MFASVILTGVGRSLYHWVTPKWQRLTDAEVMTQRSDFKINVHADKRYPLQMQSTLPYALMCIRNKRRTVVT